MIAVGIVFLILAIACAGYLIWRFAKRLTRMRKFSKEISETTTMLTSERSLLGKKKHKVKMVRCQHCEQKTIVDESGCCQWCHYPLSIKPYKEHEKKVKKAKEPKPPKERPIKVKAPFLFSFTGYLMIVVLFLLVLGGAAYGLLMTETLDDVLGSNDIYLQIKAIVNPPKPVVVSQDAFEAAPGGDYTIIGKCEVRNNGGSGKIRVTAGLNAYGQRLTKSETIYLRKGEIADVEFYFPEVTVGGRILEALLDVLIGGGWRSVTSPDVDLNISAAPAR